MRFAAADAEWRRRRRELHGRKITRRTVGQPLSHLSFKFTAGASLDDATDANLIEFDLVLALAKAEFIDHVRGELGQAVLDVSKGPRW